MSQEWDLALFVKSVCRLTAVPPVSYCGIFITKIDWWQVAKWGASEEQDRTGSDLEMYCFGEPMFADFVNCNRNLQAQ